MDRPSKSEVSVAQVNAELSSIRHLLLKMATIGTAVVSVVGLVGLAAAPSSEVPHVAVQAALALIAALAAIRILIPGENAYQQAAIMLCWSITLGQAFRAVMSFILDMPEWVGAGYVPTFVAWIILPLVLNFLFLSLRQALLLCGIFYMPTAVAMLYTTHAAVGVGLMPFNLLSMVLFFVFAGVPIGIGMLFFIAYGQQRYSDLSQQLESELQVQREQGERDDVTGCLNRRGLMRQLEDVTATELGLLAAIELDNITRHLQILGGAGAHKLLAQLGRNLMSIAGASAVVARWDAGRFYIYLRSLGSESPQQAATRIFNAVSSAPLSSETGAITLSMGASEIQAGSDLSDYLEEADLRLFLAQAGGGNRIRFDATE